MDATSGAELVAKAVPLSAVPRHVLREGSSVHVRVLSQTGPRNYALSFAGGRFDVTSELPLKPGAVFTASVSFKDGKILLAPQNGGPIFADGAFLKTLSPALNADGSLASAELAAYFSALGLPADFISLAIFTGMRELGMKFNARLAEKARLIALQFPGREKEAAEAALLLEQKGIRADKNSVAAIVGGFDGAERGGADKKNQREETSGGENNRGEKQNALENVRAAGETADGKTSDGAASGATMQEIAGEVKDFFAGVFSGAAWQSQRKGGVITIFNHCGFASDEANGGDYNGSWIQIPFNVSLASGEKGRGLLRCLIKKNQKAAERFALKIDLPEKKYYFMICVKAGQKSVRFCASPAAFGDEDALNRCMNGAARYARLENVAPRTNSASRFDEFSVKEEPALSGFFDGGGAVTLVRGSA